MRRLRRTSAVVILLLVSALYGGGQAGTEEEHTSLNSLAVFAHASKSIFLVETAGADGEPLTLGSGVAIAPNTIRTSAQVIGGVTQLSVRRGGRSWSATVSKQITELDLVLLEVPGLNAFPADPRLSRTLQIGEHVYAIGTPAGMSLSMSEGTVFSLLEPDGAQKLHSPQLAGDRQGFIIGTDAAVPQGSNGGGLFDEHARLIGFLTLPTQERQSIRYAYPVEWVAGLLPSKQAEKKAAPDGNNGGSYRTANAAPPRTTVTRVIGIPYPPLARAAGTSGTVTIRVVVRQDGKVASTTVLDGPVELREAAIDGTLGFRYECWNCPAEGASLILTYGFELLRPDPRKDCRDLTEQERNAHSTEYFPARRHVAVSSTAVIACDSAVQEADE